MIPMKPIGPPSETAAPVASDALKKASRCARDHVDAARGRRCRVPALSRLSARGSHAKIANAAAEQAGAPTRIGLIAADVEIAHQPAQRAERLGEVRKVLNEQNERREERVQRDAGEQEHVSREPRCRAYAKRVHDGDRAERAREARDGTAVRPPKPSVQLERDRQHRAERGARRDAERERRRERIPEQRLKDDARRRERRTDERAGERPRQPRDEEDLRVDVLGQRDRSIQHAPEVDGRGPHKRRGDDRGQRRDRRRR